MGTDPSPDPGGGGGESFPALLRSWRQRALLTQEQLASGTGLGVRTIRRLEADAGRPRRGSVRLLADALHLTGQERTLLIAAAQRPPTAAGTGPAGTGPPRQLPTDVIGFTGRTQQLRELDRLLDGDASATSAVVISAIAGTAGVGKTALAVHWAHRVADQFPDGQLYVNLRGYHPSGTPTEPAAAVRGFLDALDVPPQRIPAGLDAQAALYRSLLAGRRTLVVLDNARDAEQVRPLLPGGSGCLALVTSRDQLTGLVATEGARLLILGRLSPVEARELLVSRLGTDRAATGPGAVEEIIRSCARLPLALAVAAARAAARPELALADLAAELRDARTRLDAFDTGDPVADVRAVFSWSYQRLGARAARLFRLLGLHPGPDFSAPAAASLAGIPPPEARPLLGELTRAHLLVEHRPGRYTCHDLLRGYAAEQAHRIDPDAQRHAAVHRMLDHYLHTAYAATRLLNPTRDPITLSPPPPGTAATPTADHRQALAWFTAEHPVLLAAVDHAATTGRDTHTWQLAWALGDFLDLRGHWRDLVATQLTALAAAGRLADLPGQARTHGYLARAYARLARFDDAHTHFRYALDLYRQIGDQLGQAHTHYSIAYTSGRECRYGEALDQARRALDLYRAAGHRHRRALTLGMVGWFHAQLGDHQRALAICQQALTQHQDLGDRYSEAGAWDSIGYAHHHLGHHRRAITCYQHALDLLRNFGDRYSEATILTHLGDTYDGAGSPAGARGAWQHALAILDELDHVDAGQVRARLAALDQPAVDARRG